MNTENADNSSYSLPDKIQELLRLAPENSSDNLSAFIPAWSVHAGRVRVEAPCAVVEGEGETIYTGELSPGCLACKAGSWDCLFLTGLCNLGCSFCCSPSLKNGSAPLSAFGRHVDEVIANLQRIQPDGISFSGGEAFLEYDRLREMVGRFRQAFPRAYLWVYTNGWLASGQKLAELGALGIDEIRFNLAATGYNNPRVLRHVEQAAGSIAHITVEIPAIPQEAEKLLSALDTWDSLGVQFLNLHELMYEPGSLSAGLPGPRETLRTPDGHTTEIHPHSRALTLKVMQSVFERGLQLSVNDCSMQNKLRQVRGRRRLTARLAERLPGSTEALNEAGYLETICGIGPAGECFFLHIRDFITVRQAHPGFRFFHLRRMAPLSVFERKRWELVEELE